MKQVNLYILRMATCAALAGLCLGVLTFIESLLK